MIDITRIDDNLIENVDIGTCKKNLFKFESSLEVSWFLYTRTYLQYSPMLQSNRNQLCNGAKANLLKDFQLLRLRSLSSLSIFILLGPLCDLGVVFRVVKFMVVNFILYFFFLSISYYIINQWSWWIYSSEAVNQYSHYRFSVKSLHTPDWVSSLIWRAWSSWSSCSSSLWLLVGRFTSTSLSRTTWTLLQTVKKIL